MQTSGHIDVHGVSRRGANHAKNHDHFAVATLSKSIRLHQSNLSIDDDSRVHGHNQGHLFLVADGIGGAPTPARASGTAVDSVVQYFLNEMPWYHLADGEPEDVTLALEDALRNAQQEVLRNAPPGKDGPGTTMTLALVFWPDLYVAHVGDSRCYLQRRGDLRQLTTDHTLAQVREDVGLTVSPTDRSTLWNAVGGLDSGIEPEIRHETLEVGDVLVLLTDGVADDAAEGEVHRRLRSALQRKYSAEGICARLVDCQRPDDQTAVVVRFLPHEERFAEATASAPTEPLTARKRTPEPVRRPRRASYRKYCRKLARAASLAC